MTSYQWDELKFRLFVGGLVTFVVGFFVVAVFAATRDYRYQQACLRSGYPEARWFLGGQAYCVKRVNQTDVVVPLDQVRR
jgi:hypothetical protein